MMLYFKPEGIDGSIDIMQDRPWTSQGGKKIGEIELKSSMLKEFCYIAADIDKSDLAGKHAIYFVFKSATKGKSLCTLDNFEFGHFVDK